MSGFFALSRQRYEEIRTSMTGRGFKILLEVLVRGNRPVVAEVGYCFGQRTAGTTKLTWSVLASYLASVVELALARIQTSAIVTYSLLALVGAALRASLWSLSDAMSRSLTAGAVSIEVAVVVEYWLHNRCTFSRRPHRGWRNVGPLLRFHLVSAYGLAAGGGVATIIDRMVATAPPSQLSARVLTACFSLSSGAVLAVVVASYLLNTRVTWPGGNLGTTYRSQTSRPMTASTSCSISATARR
jgi:putative flippase GtrA